MMAVWMQLDAGVMVAIGTLVLSFGVSLVRLIVAAVGRSTSC